MGMAIIERLSFLEAELKLISSSINSGSKSSIYKAEGYTERLKLRFKGISLVTDSGDPISLMGHSKIRAKLSSEQKEHLASGKAILMTRHDHSHHSSIYMTIALDPNNLTKGIVNAEINSLYLWGLEEYDTLTEMIDICVFDQSDNVIFSYHPLSSNTLKKLTSEINKSSIGKFEWQDEDQEYLASYWYVFLKYAFFTQKWTVVMSVSKTDALAPMANFKKIFPLVLVLSFCVVLLLSIIQIRRSMVPLKKLREGTRRIALKEFDSRVTINSKDEFEELAGSFNEMATTLGKQFNTLTTVAEIDRAILSSLDTEEIVKKILISAKDLFACDFVSVTLLDSNGANTGRTYIGNNNTGLLKNAEIINLTSEDVQRLIANPERLLLDVNNGLPDYIGPIARHGIKLFWVLPISLKHKLAGMITLGFNDSSAHHDDDFIQARQLANQVAVALSNSRLIEELNQLNWGTLTALARAVDAKSPWTAGHSERVTQIALQIGQELGITPEEIDILHRGGLLHDIGKIGVPISILDKPGKLTDDEYRIIREHPRMGLRILEPINAYADIVNLVLQHHERFDGKGYPDGLSGEDILLGARILAVADVFDALISDRPYRDGMELARVLEIIEQEKGKQFDPRVVQVFLEIIEKKKRTGKILEFPEQSIVSSSMY
jgi:putative nucleotidyltransferase with HDIG domain